jgi:hypothetical protein
MNNTIFAARKPLPLVRVWRSIDVPGTPLVCRWTQDEAANPSSSLADSSIDETGDYADAPSRVRSRCRDDSRCRDCDSQRVAEAHSDIPDGLWPWPNRHGGRRRRGNRLHVYAGRWSIRSAYTLAPGRAPWQPPHRPRLADISSLRVISHDASRTAGAERPLEPKPMIVAIVIERETTLDRQKNTDLIKCEISIPNVATSEHSTIDIESIQIG